MQVREVTWSLLRRCMQGIKDAHDFYFAHKLTGDEQPAVNLDWDEAVGVAGWVSAQDGERGYRLPTEAEWECACRAGTTTRFAWGESEAEAYRYANLLDAKSKAEFRVPFDAFSNDDGYRATAPVGSFLPNGWGLYDMHGNALEWCLDWYGDLPAGPATDPQGPATGDLKALRGGSWNSNSWDVHAAGRRGSGPGRRYVGDGGFRLVSPLPEK